MKKTVFFFLLLTLPEEKPVKIDLIPRGYDRPGDDAAAVSSTNTVK